MAGKSSRSAKRVMILCGSPRPNGNTNTLAGWVAQGARENGAIVETVDVARLKFATNGCLACMGCQRRKGFRCVVKDEITPVLARIPQADTLVFATPTYFFGPTAQLKLLLDRMYSLWKFHATKHTCALRPEMALGLIATAGGGKDGGIQVLKQTFKVMAGFTGHKLHCLTVPNAPADPKDMARQAALRKKAILFGKNLTA